ncbi:hypothetical protein ACN4EG_25430 [Alkalinema pantanalense CENA528]|uniref:hypothetical protein n=1 Tax=Alkalinema pantanalense TaxID=1620705 RepID=UPI003D6DF644
MQVSNSLPRFQPSARSRRRVLIVSPHFPPINAPDHQRIRVALPYLQEFGWEAQILAVKPHHVPHPQDAKLAEALPQDLPIVYSDALSTRYTKLVGLGNVGWRCLPEMQKIGDRLLSTQQFDLVFFSTTIFPVMLLGKRWWQKFGVPYVLDFQDPWLSDYHTDSTSGRKRHSRPPGGWLKYGMTQFLARWAEPQAMEAVRHIISVSPSYPNTLQQRYPHLHPEQFTVLPFGAPEADFAALPNLNIKQTIFDPQDGKRHWVYVGRGGEDMATALRILFEGIQTARWRNPELWQNIHLHFVGTSYAPAHLAVKTIETIAQSYGLGDLVTEHTGRIPYFEAQQLLVDSDAILMIGSDDPSYTASKLYPCILAQKPILAVFHENSSVVDILQNCRAGKTITFNTDRTGSDRLDNSPTPDAIQSILNSFAQQQIELNTNWDAFQPYSGKAMTRQMCQIFDRCLTQTPTP